MNQEAKKDEGKLQLTLVPRQIIKEIARVRMYGNQKYKDPENWKQVEPERYRDAAFRQFLAYLDDPDGLDEESGLPHISHLATNLAFLCEFDLGEEQVIPKDNDKWICNNMYSLPRDMDHKQLQVQVRNDNLIITGYYDYEKCKWFAVPPTDIWEEDGSIPCVDVICWRELPKPHVSED